MNDKHDPNASVPIGTFTATTDDGEFEIPIEVVAEEDIEPEKLGTQRRSQPTRGYDEHTPAEVPRRKRVQTLMGVAMPGTALGGRPPLPAAHDPTRATSHEISAAIDDVLDEQPTSIYGQRDSGGLKALESMLEAQMIELPPSVPPAEIVGVVGRETETGTYEVEVRDDPDTRKSMPVLAPKQFVEARARDSGDQAGPSRPRTEPQPRAAGSASATTTRSGLEEPSPYTRTAPQPSAADRASSPEASTRGLGELPLRGTDELRTAGAKSAAARRAKEPERQPAKPSSLAPTEIRGRAAQQSRESPVVGYGLVAAMVLLGIGGWWLTAGGYRRGGDEQAAQPTAAAVPQPPPESLASPKVAAAARETPEPAVAPPAEVQPPAPAPARVAPRPAKPKVAAKTVKTPAPAPTPAPVAEAGIADTPSRDDVLNGLDRVRSSVQACAEGRTGVAEVDVTIAANGKVTNALVGGDFGGTPQGSCIARAVRRAKFPSFKQDRYRVLFPYVL